jgi:LPS-assembly protein
MARTRLLITTAWLCHLLVCPGLVTSQLRPARPGEAGEEVTIKAEQQEQAGPVYTLRGNAEITMGKYVLKADQVTYDKSSGQVVATGHVVFNGGSHDEHLTASRAVYNVNTDRGDFYDVVGSTGAKIQGRNVILTTSNPFSFTGQWVQKLGRDLYVVHHGSVTSCALPHPKWTFNTERAVVQVGGDAKLYHATFRLGGVPLFYFPFAEHPVEQMGRQSGFLIPLIGQSSKKGTIIGDSFYWAINRSLDTTIGAEYYSHIGWGQLGNFRARPTDSSYVELKYFGVIDHSRARQGGEEVSLDADGLFPHGFRGVAAVDYLSSFVYRLAFAETFAQAVNSEVKSAGFLSRTRNGFSLNTMVSRYQNYQSTVPGDLIMILHAPGVEAAQVDRQISRLPLYWSFDAAAEGVSRREPTFITANVVGRLDLNPQLTMPWQWRGWSFRPQVGIRETVYSQRLLSGVTNVGTPISEAVNRKAYETAFEIRPPALARVFDRPFLGQQWKHTLEPWVTYRLVTGVNNFPDIIRFDWRDILSDTNELEYGFVTRLYAKPATAKDGNAPPASREVLSWEVAQKWFADPSFGGALVNGRRNVFTTTADFTGIAFLTEPRPFSPIISRLLLKATKTTDIQWNLDYDTRKGRINASTLLVSQRLGEYFIGGSHAFLHSPGEVIVSQPIVAPQQFDQIRFTAGYGHPNKRGFSTAANIGYDFGIHLLQYGAMQTTYNWDCCGFTFEYRRFAIPGVRNENQYRFGLSLANVGTFGTLRKQERLF